VPEESPIPGDMFLIASSDPWYGDILIYLQTLKSPTSASRDERRRIRHQAKNYLILDDTLYRRGVDCILRRCLTHEDAIIVLNDFHIGACGGHLSGLETAQKILRAGYFWLTLIKDCIESVKKCHPCQVFSQKMRAHPAPMFLVITVGPFTKWGIDYTTLPRYLETIQCSHYQFNFFDCVSNGFKLFFDLRHPCEVGLNGF
jgi:hypothetical protein